MKSLGRLHYPSIEVEGCVSIGGAIVLKISDRNKHVRIEVYARVMIHQLIDAARKITELKRKRMYEGIDEYRELRDCCGYKPTDGKE